MIETEYVIVGQGLAGTCLARELDAAGVSFLVVDQPVPTASSRVAAGMINPLTFRRLIPSWNALELLPVATAFYAAMEADFGQDFLFDRPVYKVFGSDEERPFWEENAHKTPGVEIELDAVGEGLSEKVNDPYGGGTVRPAYWLNIPAVLTAAKSWLTDTNRFLEGKLDYSSLIPGEPVELTLNGRSIVTKRVIFAEGIGAIQNPWFSWLPFRPAKGELLTIEAPALPETYTIKKNIFLLPVGNHQFRVGSTYNWQDDTDAPTAAGREELEKKTAQLLKVPFKVVDHDAGIRPTVLDRRPFLGPHPHWDCLWIFNGLGTRGGLLAPALAKQVANAMIFGTELMPDTSIQRHIAKHFPFAVTV